MARANRLAQGTSCATRKPYPSPSGATHVIFEPLDFMYRMYGMPRAHDCRDAGGRAMPGAIAEEAHERPYPDWFPWFPSPGLTWHASTGCSPKAPTFGAPNSKYRALVTPARRGKCKKTQSPDETDQTPAEKRASMTWAKRLKQWDGLLLTPSAPMCQTGSWFFQSPQRRSPR